MKKFKHSTIKKAQKSWELTKHVLAQQIVVGNTLDDIEAKDIVLLNFSEKLGENLRQKLYGFTILTGSKIIDFGHYIGNDLAEIMQFLNHCSEKQAICIIVSENLDAGLQHEINSLNGDERVLTTTISRNVSDISILYENKRFMTIANQIHRSIPTYLKKSENSDTLRLGELRAFFTDSEPYFRNANRCFIDLSAIKGADAPAQKNPSSSGLTSEECCQLAKYAGSSEQINLLWIHGYQSDKDTHMITADLIAQLMWYFVLGTQKRTDTYPPERATLQAYVLEFDTINAPLHFFKSLYEDRWWVKADMSENAELLPCSPRDYEKAKIGELSDRLIRLLNMHD